MYFEKRASKKAKKGYSWQVCFYYTDPSNGMRKRYKKSGFETKAEAQKHGQEAQKQLEGGIIPNKEKNLSYVFSEWIRLNADRLAPGTVQNYKTYISKHLASVAAVPIDRLKYAALQELFNSMDLSKDAKKNVKALLTSVFKHAIISGYTENNPAAYLILTGKEKKPTEDVLELADVEMLCDSIKSKKHFTQRAYQMFIWIGYYAGLRASEILALEWSDIDMDQNTISITKQLDQNGIVTDRLKTKSSRAVIPLADPLRSLLIEWKQMNSENELIICKQNGDPVPHTSVSKALTATGKRTGIKVHPHLLRHTFVTNVVRSGADPKTAAQLARHSDISTTLNIYTQMNAEDLQAAIKTAYPESPKKAPKTAVYQA